MTAVITYGLAGLALRVYEGPASAQSSILRTRSKILRLAGMPMKLLAAGLLPFLYILQWILMMLMAVVAPFSMAANRRVIRHLRGELVTADLASLRQMAQTAGSFLPKLEELQRVDDAIRQKSETYRFFLSGFGLSLEENIANAQDILEAIQIGLDPKWRERLMNNVRDEGARVA